eukprot:CAMPEP_0197184038 /NCGR_PEP_ID=MMETSP1423-20130617/9084_1 /TAXON_ID=476441 /ORGANISM="Pseudo-nitzschia heimii, Strain UNC1101" /LENGTH=121 /DNA_ID=CAMNT_0042634755 /DNA_START=112 /DNA_END=474 /DNA_ORIENTATION=-
MKYVSIAFLFASVVATVFGNEDAAIEQEPRDLAGYAPVHDPYYPPTYYGGKGGKGTKGGYYSPPVYPPKYPAKCDSSPYCYGSNCCKQDCYEVCYPTGGKGGKGGKGGFYYGGYYGGKGGK